MSNTSAVPKLTAKRQVTVPVGIRYALDLAPGDSVVFAIEDGRGVFRKATSLDGLLGSFAVEPRAGAHALERLLVEGDGAFATDVEAHRRRGTRLRLPDAVLLDVAASLVRRGASAASIAGALRDVLADRAVRVDHPSALRGAIDALAAGGDPVRAYALARG
jgi:bifunctional DNA-binding transcriptional regulator/antitoxin component of YhaV-PrlF toxin-antitoxin module